MAVALLGLIVTYVVNLFPMSWFALQQSREQAHGAEVASAALEASRSRPFNSFIVGSSTPQTPVVLDGLTYTPTLTASAVPGENTTYLVNLTVTVTWTSRNTAHQVSMQRRVANIAR